MISPSTPRKGAQAERLYPIALLMVVLGALALRLIGLQAQSIWYDEGWSIHLAREPLGRALAQIASEGHTHPPGYYLVLMIWVRLFGHGVFAVRALSAVVGALTVWAVYALGAYLFDRSTGLMGAILLALAPAHVVYSQEARMYALLAFCCALVWQLAARCVRQGGSWGWCQWAALVAAEAGALYCHYFGVFVLVVVDLWVLAHLVGAYASAGEGEDEHGAPPTASGLPQVMASAPARLRATYGRVRDRQSPACQQTLPRRAVLWRWLLSQAAVGLLFTPWLPVALRRVATHAALGAQPPVWWRFLQEAWTFLLGGHIALLGREPLYATLALAGALAWLAAVAWLLWRDGASRRATLYLALGLALPLAGVYILMRARPGFHPRYLLMLLTPIVLLAGRAIVVGWRSRWVARLAAIVFLALWLGTSAVAARALLTDSYYARDDARATAAFLTENLPIGARVIVDNDDWALRYYLERSGLADLYLQMDRLPQDAVGQVSATLVGQAEAALVKWHQGETDRRGLLPFALERRGTLVRQQSLPAYSVSFYALDAGASAVLRQDVHANFGPLRLEALDCETLVPADEAITVALTWSLDAPVARDLKVALALVDAGGRDAARADLVLHDALGRGTASWPVGEEFTTYYALPLGAGLAPTEYTLMASIYHEGAPQGLDVLDAAGAPAGKRLALVTLALDPPQGRTGRTVDRPRLGLTALAPAPAVAPGLALAAWGLERDGSYRTGERLSVLLEWHATAPEALPDYWPELRLVRGGQELAALEAAPAYDQYPTSWWLPDETVLDWRDLIVPAELVGGPAELQVRVRGEPPIALGAVQIEAVARIYDPPIMQRRAGDAFESVAALAGYDLAAPVAVAGQPYDVTLYWLAQGEPARLGYTVFVHLLTADGRLIAQHDGPPARGERPTTGWVAGEYIADPHALEWVDTTYSGAGMIEVGLYDPATGVRLRTRRGDVRLLLLDAITVE